VARKKSQLPTDAELSVLRVLWRLGPSTVRDVHAELASGEGIGYTTVLKIMQIMADKGLVRRDESQRAHVYEPVASQAQTQRRLLRDLAQRAFDGSPGKLVLRALADDKASKEDLAEIRRLLDQLEEGDAS
jgi:predicted transcriptional regulator